MNKRDSGITRRDFVQRSLGAVALPVLSVAGGCASLVTRTVRPVDGALRLSLVHYPELATPGGSLRVLPEGATEPILVFALENRRFAALSPRCTHLECTVEVQGARLVCPCHGSTFDREGAVLQGPATRPLARYREVLSADGVLSIHLSRGASDT